MISLTPALAVPLLVLLSVQGVDERPAALGEWGFRPAEGSQVERTPPSFCWRPQAAASRYELQASRNSSFEQVDYAVTDIEWNVHCPTRVFEPGAWAWRFRFVDAVGKASSWSSTRHFVVPADAAVFTLPPREELLARIPRQHPRLFLRPEDLPALRAAATGSNRERFEQLLARCDALLAQPPATEEPPLYPPGTVRGSDPWRSIWWGNRKQTIRVLESAATLAFVWRVSEREEFGLLARRLLMDVAAWDPLGATGYRYNDEAGMPYAYHFSRTYTLLFPLLDGDQRATCREVMRVRGREMYAHLAPRHLWKPYSSHSNRAWHFLGEVGIAFQGELPEADDWIWFASNVFANVYPVWSDADGGWHEGTAYWRSYLSRFTWWADVQRSALGLNAYDLPFFSRAGDWAVYLMPPGSHGGGFGDQNASRDAAGNRELMSVLADQASNPTWRWYVDQLGGPSAGSGWIGFLRSSRPALLGRAPVDLPTSRCFRGTGIAVLQSSLLDARENVEILFKSSPFGSQSHGYEGQNSFLLYAFGERLLIRSGKRDSYGSAHHRKWMWETKSTNNITVNGRGQLPHSGHARGEITGFKTRPGVHWVQGEAQAAYEGRLERYTRGILFLEPDLILIHDRLRAPEPAQFEWNLHAQNPFEETATGLTVRAGEAACQITFLAPDGLTWTQTDRYDTPLRERVKLVEHHLTAIPERRAREQTFLTVLRPYRVGDEPPAVPRLELGAAGLLVTAELAGGTATIRLAEDGSISASLLEDNGEVVDLINTAPGELKSRPGAPRH